MPAAIIDRREITSEGILPTCEFTLIYVYEIPGLSTHTGLLKVGETTLKAEFDAEASDFDPNCGALNKAADKRIQQDLGAAGVPYNLLHTELAVDIDGKSFGDKRVHKVLENSGVERTILRFNNRRAREWFRTDLRTARLAIASVKNKMPTISYELPLVETPFTKTPTPYEAARNKTPDLPIPAPNETPPEQIEFRDEQERAIKKTVKYFEKKLEDAEPSRTGKRDREFLWNAKMRFGKTLCALEVVKRLKFRRTLIVTHRPVVRDGWGKDFKKIFRQGDLKEQYEFSFNRDESFSNYKNTKNPLIYFASLQYLRRLDETLSGIQEKKEILGTDWDLVIVDEAHEGTQTELGAFVLENLKKERTCLLHLSGTPFNMAKDFDESNSFTWDYLMEQRAKLSWPENHPGEHNPYDDLPNMNILVYSLGDLEKTYMDVADKCFSFTEFFSIRENEKTFVHEQDVKKFLDLLAGKSSQTKTYPFSTDEYREFFRHTFWVVPGVKQGAALEKLLKDHPVFGKFRIVNVCGDGGDDDRAGENALEAVQNAIKENERTITLSCGKLTLGVSVPEWTAVFYLAGSYHTRVATYMQTIFRAQTPGSINGKTKKECYVFDFAPDRTLTIIDEVAQHAAKASGISLGRVVGKLLNNFNVISVDGSQTRRINENLFFSIVNKACVTEIVRKGFESIKLFDDDLLRNLSAEDMAIFDGLKAKIGSRKLRDPITEIPVNEEGLTGEEHEIIEDNPDPKKKKPPKTPEQREAERRRKVAIATLLSATVRIPLLVFGAGAGKTGDKPKREFTIENFTENFDPESWKEFMGDLSMEDFNEKVVKWLKRDRFTASCQRIRERVEDADSLPPKERMEKIVEIHSEFKNPNKETVLTPWKAVNRHLGETLGGYNFFDKNYEKDILKEAEEEGRVANPRFISNEATKETLENPDAKILEINSKTGLYPLYVAYSLMRAKLNPRRNESVPDAEKRTWKEVVEKNLFVICRTKMAKAITRRTLLGFDTEAEANIRVREDFVETAAELVSEKNDRDPSDSPKRVAELQAQRRAERLKKLEEFLKYISTWNDKEMKFNAIVGNPPYQREVKDTTDDPLYHYFVELAMSLNPEYISLIIPSRWMTASGSEMVSFRQKMLSDTRIDVLHDLVESDYIFPKTSISGGVCFFRWNREHNDKCKYTLHNVSGKTESLRFLKTPGSDIFIRYQTCVEILEKVQKFNDPSFADLVSGQTPFRGLFTNFFKSEEGKNLSKKSFDGAIVIWGKCGDETTQRYAPESIFSNGNGVIDDKTKSRIEAWKFFIPYVNGSRVIGATTSTNVIGFPIEATKNSACTQTFLLVGPFASKKQTENAISYLKTKTFRLLVGLRKITPYGSRDVYSFVPMQDFSEPWTDERLFKKYKFTEEERAFIKKMIAPMK